MKTLRRRRPVDERRRVERTGPDEPTMWSTARHLDETITLQGFYCLHDCRWPGTRNGRIDHVTIGATGVWVLHDVHPANALSVNGSTLQAGATSLDPELRRLRDQATVLSGILGEVEVQPLLSVHDVPLPRHAFQVDDVKVAAALWSTSQVMARPTPFLTAMEVERLALVAIEALRPASTTGPRLSPPGAPTVSLPFVPCGSPVEHAPQPWAATETDEVGEEGRQRRSRLLRRSAAGAVAALLALGVAVELTGDQSTLLGDPVADDAPASSEAPSVTPAGI